MPITYSIQTKAIVSLFYKFRINIKLVSKYNNKIQEHAISCNEGDTLLDCINEIGIPDISVFGVCDKQLACHSCAVHILSNYEKLPRPSEEEIDVHSELGEIYRERSTRMSCQIKVTKEMEGMSIEIPRSAFFFLNDDLTSKNPGEKSSDIKKLK